MKKIVLCAFFIFAVFVSSLCLAEEIKGKADEVDAALSVLTVSGVKVAGEDAVTMNGLGMPVDFSVLKPGDYIEADGAFTGPGQMAAQKIKKKAFGEEGIKGKVLSVDPASSRIVIGGVEVTAEPNADIEDDDGNEISIEEIPIGASVDCEGRWSGPLMFSASEIEID